ncbi:MAG TPA: esterase-like activity of phytase family protein [Stellaceae bacterium]
MAQGPVSVNFEGATFVNQGLVGVTRVPSDARDQFGDTLGGFGSAMAMEPGTWHKNRDGSFSGTLFMVPDRGWNTQGTVDYRGRVHHFDITLRPFTGASTTLQNQLTMNYRGSVLMHESSDLPGFGFLKDRQGVPTTGIDPLDVRPAFLHFPDLPVDGNNHIALDNEGIVVPGDGTMWVSDEYGPYVYHYTLDGTMLGAIRPPDAFIPMRLDPNTGKPVENFSANSPPIGQTYNTGNPVSGRQNNQGFEGLAMSPDGSKLFILLQSAAIQDLDATSATTIKHTRGNTRLLAYDIRGFAPRLVGEYAVQLPQFHDPATAANSGLNLTAAQSEMHALNDHQFLVLARDSGNGFSDGDANSTSLYRSIDLIDISHATNFANTKFDNPANPIAPKGMLLPSITPAAYQPFLNINDNNQLNRFNLHNGPPNDPNDLYEKWESIAIVPVLDPRAPHDYYLFVGSDNDFITTHGSMIGVPYVDKADVDTLVLVYRVTLPTYVPPRNDVFAFGIP